MSHERYTGPNPEEESASAYTAVFTGAMTFTSAPFETSNAKSDEAYDEQCERLYAAMKILEDIGWDFRLTKAEVTGA